MDHYSFIPVEQPRDGLLDVPPIKITRERLDEVMETFQDCYPELVDFSRTYASFTDEETEYS